jgi:exonuclease III
VKASKLGKMLNATRAMENPAEFFSFRLKYETITSDLPSAFRIAAPAADDNGSTGQCYHIIAGYAPTTAHTNAECEEYYDELDEHIAKKRQNGILIIAADCNANVGNRRSWAKDKPAKVCLGNHGNGRKNARGERFLDFCLEHSLVIASTCCEKKYYNTWTSTFGNGRGYQLDHFCVQRCAMRRIVDCGHMQKPIGNSDHTGIKLVI